ncbi:hypothetical protein QYF36_015559 [Acer negundo]|nr:hypothetical protein QYF36_015559 [Acer negundo]
MGAAKAHGVYGILSGESVGLRTVVTKDSSSNVKTISTLSFNPELKSFKKPISIKNRIKFMSNVVFLDLFYDFSDEISLEGRSNSINCREGTGFYTSPLYVLQLPNVTSTCEKRIEVPVLRTALQDLIQNRSDFQQTLNNKGFDVEFKAAMTPCIQFSWDLRNKYLKF